MANDHRVRARVLNALARAGRAPCRVTQLGGGANSRVFGVLTSGGESLAAKAYLAPTAEGQSRLDVEFQALVFLTENGVREVPAPVAEDAPGQVGLFELVEGSGDVTPDPSRLARAAGFLTRLHELSAFPRAALLPPASAAVLESGALGRNAAGRIRALAGIKGDSPGEAMARAFARNELSTALSRFAPLEPSPGPWTLSPSDFGFHNARIRPDGTLCFLDFEYFGRDDPAKLLCDVLLHPGNRMDMGQRRWLVRALLPAYRDPGLGGRMADLYPLAALMWCAIILNPFLPGHHLHVASGRSGRLGAARDMLARAWKGLDPGEIS